MGGRIRERNGRSKCERVSLEKMPQQVNWQWENDGRVLFGRNSIEGL